MPDRQIFDSTLEGKRRSVLFALAQTTAFIGIVAATNLLLASTGNLPIVVALLVASLVFVGFGLAVYAGYFEGLVTDRQLLWRVLDFDESR